MINRSAHLTAVLLVCATAFTSCNKDEDGNGTHAVFTEGRFVENDCAEADSLHSLTGTLPTSIFFKNESSQTLKIYWVNFTGGRTLYHDEVTPGESELQGTFLEHPWYIANADEECITVVTALRPTVTDTVIFRD
ncbi:MAG: hypothetical protein K9J06_14350 [Flavobacteriales bacterium]|nr:hypothetical protein [Flavobacteriales bacterium]